MGEASAFGLACRARGELNVDGIVKLQLRTQGLNTCHVFGPRQCADIGKIEHTRGLRCPQANDVLQVW